VRDAFSRVTLERALQLSIVCLILTAVLASGSILAWVGPARKLRWAALAVVIALAVAAAAGRGRVARPARPVLLAAAAFLALGLASIGWSAFPRLSTGRWAALVGLFVAGLALATAGAGRPVFQRRLLDAVVAGCAAVGVGGLLVLAFDHDRAVEPATTSLPARYQGLGGGPNTATMVLAVGAPLAALALVDARRPWIRAAAAASLLLLLGSIVASGSRGALAGAFGGLLAFAVLATRRLQLRLAAAAAVALLAAVAVALTRLPSPAKAAPGASPSPATRADAVLPFRPKPGYLDANALLRLQDDVGHPPFGVPSTASQARTLTGSSGRTEAWRGAIHLGAERPLLGFGIGTEDHVFVDRYVGFNSNVPENSYIGLFLQLGGFGLAAFLALVVALLSRAALAARRLRGQELRIAAGAAGGLVAGLVLGGFQSFLVAVGNNATAAVWICAFVLAAATTTRASAARA
jgi:hypothetical protein